MTFQLSPGVYPFEIDKSAFVSAQATNIGAAVAGLIRGPLGRKLVTNVEEYEKLYGHTPASWSKADYCIKAALQQTSAFYVNRIVNGALYAGTSIINDRLNNKTSAAKFPTGSSLDYESGSRDIETVSIDNPLVLSNKISVDINDGEGNTTVVEQEFTNTSNETLNLFAAKLQTELDKLATGGSASVVDVWTSSDRNEQISIDFSDYLSAQNCTSISGKISVHGKISNIAVDFDTDNDTTISALVDALNAVNGITALPKSSLTPNTNRTVIVNCDTAGPDSIFIKDFVVSGTNAPTVSSEVLKEGHGVYDDRTVQVVFPENSQAFLENANISGGDSQAVIKVETNVKLFDVFAENPGDWANNYGIKISDIDRGIASRFNMTFNGALKEGNIFNVDIKFNDANLHFTQAFAGTSDATLKALAEQITAELEPLGHFGRAFVEEVIGGSENDRVVTVISPTAESDIEILNALVTGGETQPMCTVAQVLDRVASTNTFTLEVFSRDNINTPVESFVCSFNEQLDGNGVQQFIEEVINKGSGASAYIRVKLNVLAKLEMLSETSICWLAGGDNGAIPTNSQIAQGWNEFADPEKVTVRLLVNCGYTNVAVQQAMTTLAATRKDCFAILDCPSDQQSAEAYVNYRKFKLNINSSYAAIYGPDLLITDPETNMQMYIPPSGHVCARYAYTDNVRAPWWAPAGLNRGIINDIEGVRVVYGEGERDLLSKAQCNYIRDWPGNGRVIWEEYTLQSKASALQDVHVRRLLITLEVSITDFLVFAIFDPNDRAQREQMALAVEEYCETVQRQRGFQDINGENGYLVKCDDDNNPAYLIDQGIMVMDVYIKPIRVTRFIKLNCIITKSSASFSEMIANAA